MNWRKFYFLVYFFFSRSQYFVSCSLLSFQFLFFSWFCVRSNKNSVKCVNVKEVASVWKDRRQAQTEANTIEPMKRAQNIFVSFLYLLTFWMMSLWVKQMKKKKNVVYIRLPVCRLTLVNKLIYRFSQCSLFSLHVMFSDARNDRTEKKKQHKTKLNRNAKC